MFTDLVNYLVLEYQKAASDKSAIGWIGGLLALFGFSILGLLSTIRKFFRIFLRWLNRRRDIKRLGDEYDVLLALAIRDGCHAEGASGSLFHALKEKKANLRTRLIVATQSEVTELEKCLALGSSRITYSDILRGPPLLMQATIRSLRMVGCTSIDSLISSTVYTRSFSQPTRPTPNHSASAVPQILLLGNAGEGKSLACLQLRHRVAREQGVHWCLFFSAQDFPQTSGTLYVTHTLGTREWAARSVASRIDLQAPTDLEIKLLGQLIDDEAIVIIDALDEIAQRQSKADSIALMSSWILSKAALVTSRLSHFQAALDGLTSLKGFSVFVIDPPTMDKREVFVKSVCEKLYGVDVDRKAQSVIRAIGAIDSVEALTETPMMLLMLAELADVKNWDDHPPMAIDVYGHWFKELTRKEVQATYSELSLTDLLWALEDLASFALGGLSPTDGLARVQLDMHALDSTISSRFPSLDGIRKANLITLLINSPILATSGTGDPLRKFVAFRHESFAEFLLASRLYDWLIGSRIDGDNFFQTIETPEITLFVKEYFSVIRTDESVRLLVSKKLFSLLNNLLSEARSTNIEKHARLAIFAAGQVAYYLGMIATGTVRELIVKIADEEPNFWIRRAAAIGLMFGGSSAPYHRLIDELRHGMSIGDLILCRRHIAIELAFYGDQGFDISDPTYDRGGNSCRRLVTRVSDESAMTVERPNWRLDLFDLIFLWRHRPSCREEFCTTIKEVAPRLLSSLDAIEASANNRIYPEPAEVRALLAEVMAIEIDKPSEIAVEK